MKVQTLEEYIEEHFRSANDFAEAQGVKPQQITQWKSKGFIVIDHRLYSERRVLSLGGEPVDEFIADKDAHITLLENQLKNANKEIERLKRENK